MNDIVNWDSNKDNDASWLNNAEAPAEQLHHSKQLENDEADWNDRKQTDVEVASREQQNDEREHNAVEDALHCVGHHSTSQLKPRPGVACNLETLVDARAMRCIEPQD